MTFLIGDIVTYHGSITEYHGYEYKVLEFVGNPYDSDRGWVLQRTKPMKVVDESNLLYNVHSQSISLKEPVER